ncbi:GSCFA domain-containing protein [uncultured Alistipes sp.]|uniref:GSCFA domain-containing protein n=1 Tax=uncultured Alistipes sp. TaxID=538949 RepID=UPI0026374A2C|nr:GSCFA domain-containing protein [uncultured Alistipes sp.]
MKFRTEIEPAPRSVRIGYDNRILTLGSCFAAHIAGRLAAAKFHVIENPSGILFNPLSIAAAIRSYALPAPVFREELEFDGEMWYHFGFHGDFSAPTADEALRRMNAARQAGAAALRTADRMILTLGTAWVYEREGQIVANCHRRPAAEFTRRRLGVAEIVGSLAPLIEGPLAGKQILLTVSPVRHLGDGLEGNAVSKAALRLAVEELKQSFRCVDYFPAFEILTDDLRDYRFYAGDLVHPAPQAIAYVWEKFVQTALDDRARQLLPEVEAIVAAAAHRPRNPHGEAHRAFCRRQLERIEAIPEVDFQRESTLFRQCIEINS